MRLLAIFFAIFLNFQQDGIESKLNSIVNGLDKTYFSTKDQTVINKYIDTYLTWKIQENSKAYLMTLDYPYPVANPVDYLSFTIVKFKTQTQPKVFSISVSSKINYKKGISLYFGKRLSGKSQKITIDKISLQNLKYTDIKSDFLKISFDDMKYKDINLSDLFMKNDHLFIEFFDNANKIYTIDYPLFKFNEQFKNLK
ncbi:MAG: hypothetical protein PHR83_05315 [Paludibacter sp.]|nr:hypothetical protein [Paludibacter sp.]